MKLLKKRFGRRRVDPPAVSAEDAQLASYIRGNVLPRAADTYDHYVPSRWIGKNGIEFNEAEQLARLEKWRGPAFQDLYRVLRNDEKINSPFGSNSVAASSGRTWGPLPNLAPWTGSGAPTATNCDLNG